MNDKHCEETIDLTSLHLFKIEVPSTELYFSESDDLDIFSGPQIVCKITRICRRKQNLTVNLFVNVKQDLF